MSDQTVPAPDPTPVIPAPAPVTAEDNSTIRALREAQATEKARATAAEAELARVKAESAVIAERMKAIERDQMTEQDRLRADAAEAQRKLTELEPEAVALRDTVKRHDETFAALYAAELATVPEKQRPTVEALAGSGKWPERIAALRNAKDLIASAVPAVPVAPAVAGTATRPGTAPPAGTEIEAKPRHPRDISWGEAATAMPNRQLGHIPGKV